jgi:hypothetical protein
MKFEDKNQ